jgi:hypothetical protein
MDASAARHLRARLSIGVPVGVRFEVVAVDDPRSPLRVGDTGTLLAIEGERARLRVDVHGELDVDPHSVTLRQVLQQIA